QVLNRTGRGTSQGEPVAEGGVAVTVMVHLPGGDISEASRERQRPEHFELERQRPETSPVADAPGSSLCLALGRPGGLLPFCIGRVTHQTPGARPGSPA